MATAMGLSATLRKRADGIWKKILDHPFVQGLGDGTLSLDRFTFYLRQDYAFLIEYSRTLGVAMAKAPDLEGMTHFAQLAHATLTQEMELHRRYCARFGISQRDLERTQPMPTTTAYAKHLLAVAYQGSIREIAAALLPCQWGYYEIALHLRAAGDPSRRNRYAQWLRIYASDDFRALGEWLQGYLDRQAVGVSAQQRRRLEAVYRTSSRYEYLFWEMAYRKEQWPV